MKRKIIIAILTFLMFSNLPFVVYMLPNEYNYSNSDNSFTYNEEAGKGKSYIGCERLYGQFLCQHPEKDQGDNRLYRNFTIKPWQFWQWGEMIFHNDRFKLPYKKF
jgi:hypothetical protein